MKKRKKKPDFRIILKVKMVKNMLNNLIEVNKLEIYQSLK